MPTRLPVSPDPENTWREYIPAQAEFDLVIIGGGSGGYAAARTAIGLGLKTAVIEGGKEIGGLCILRGCMPSKSLLESAHRCYEIKRAREFGLVVKGVSADMKSIQARKRHLIEDFADYRRKQLKKGAFTFVRGSACFVDPNHLLVRNGKRCDLVSSRFFIIATGSEINHVEVPGLQETGFWTSDDALNSTEIPRRLAVLGGGIVAVELGQFFTRVGSETTLLQRSPKLVKLYDPDVSDVLKEALQEDGMKVETGVQLVSVEATQKGKKVTYEQNGKRKSVVVDEILCALGRSPAISKLNLPAAGIGKEGDTKLPTQMTMQTSASHIFAVGDVNSHHEVVHIAIQQGELAARNIAKLAKAAPGENATELESIDYRLKTLVTFTDPEIALVGLSEVEARQKNLSITTAKYPFDDHGKSIIGGHLHGFVKIIAETSRGEILGAEIIGPHASDLIHEMIAVIHYRGTARELASLPHYHPTLAEIITYPAEEVADFVDSLHKK